MPSIILFSEQQYFRQWWLKLLFVFLYLPLLYFSLEESTSGLPVYFLYGMMILFTLWFFNLNLKTKITTADITVVFDFVIYRYYRKFQLTDIKEISVITYNPIMDCGGWGIKWWKNGQAYNIAGNKGFEIVLQDNKKYLIGTQKAEQVKRIINQLIVGTHA